MTRPRRLESATCPLSPAPTPGLPESPHASSRAKQAWLLAKTKSGQTEQNPAKPEQRKSKKDGWISLVSHVHFEPFQRVTATPPRQKIFLALLPPRPPRWPRLVRRRGQNSVDSVFRKEKVDSSALPGRDRALAQPGARSIRGRPRLCLLRHNLTQLTDLRPTFRRNGLRIDFFAQ
jgi:hypothetical protein